MEDDIVSITDAFFCAGAAALSPPAMECHAAGALVSLAACIPGTHVLLLREGFGALLGAKGPAKGDLHSPDRDRHRAFPSPHNASDDALGHIGGGGGGRGAATSSATGGVPFFRALAAMLPCPPIGVQTTVAAAGSAAMAQAPGSVATAARRQHRVVATDDPSPGSSAAHARGHRHVRSGSDSNDSGSTGLRGPSQQPLVGGLVSTGAAPIKYMSYVIVSETTPEALADVLLACEAEKESALQGQALAPPGDGRHRRTLSAVTPVALSGTLRGGPFLGATISGPSGAGLGTLTNASSILSTTGGPSASAVGQLPPRAGPASPASGPLWGDRAVDGAFYTTSECPHASAQTLLTVQSPNVRAAAAHRTPQQRIVVLVLQHLECASPAVAALLCEVLAYGTLRDRAGVVRLLPALRVVGVTDAETLATSLPTPLREAFGLSACVSVAALRDPQTCPIPPRVLQALLQAPDWQRFVDDPRRVYAGPAVGAFLRASLTALATRLLPGSPQLTRVMQRYAFFERVLRCAAFLFCPHAVLAAKADSGGAALDAASQGRQGSPPRGPPSSVAASASANAVFSSRVRATVTTTDVLCLLPHLTAHLVAVNRLEHHVATRRDVDVTLSVLKLLTRPRSEAVLAPQGRPSALLSTLNLDVSASSLGTMLGRRTAGSVALSALAVAAAGGEDVARLGHTYSHEGGPPLDAYTVAMERRRLTELLGVRLDVLTGGPPGHSNRTGSAAATRAAGSPTMRDLVVSGTPGLLGMRPADIAAALRAAGGPSSPVGHGPDGASAPPPVPVVSIDAALMYPSATWDAFAAHFDGCANDVASRVGRGGRRWRNSCESSQQTSTVPTPATGTGALATGPGAFAAHSVVAPTSLRGVGGASTIGGVAVNATSGGAGGAAAAADIVPTAIALVAQLTFLSYSEVRFLIATELAAIAMTMSG